MRLTEAEFADLQRRRSVMPAKVLPKKSKYGNVRCQSADGKHFDSKLERDYYERLLMLWKAGQVFWFVRQVNFELEGGVKYRADFVVNCPAGVTVMDTTGMLTRAKANKLKQMRSRYGIDVQLVRKV